MYKSLALLAFLPSAFAHFVLNYPASLGFDDDAEGNGPCGGFDITFNETRDTNVSVGGFTTTSRTTHPQANWLFRATLSTAEPFNWTNIVPVVQQYGLGDFCLQNLTLPENFAGQRGVIQVIQNAVDGNLYQCAAVNFVSGSSSFVPEGCPNAQGVTYSLTSQTSLEGSSNATSSASSTGAASSPTSNAGAVKQAIGGLLAIVPAGLVLL